MVGVDIGCGMELVRIAEKEIDLDALDKLIYEKIPSGFNYRDKHRLRWSVRYVLPRDSRRVFQSCRGIACRILI